MKNSHANEIEAQFTKVGIMKRLNRLFIFFIIIIIFSREAQLS